MSDARDVDGRRQRLEELKQRGVRFIRLQYADLHGVSRGKVIPIGAFEQLAEDGIAFAGAVMTCDLRHNTVSGFENGIPDMLARPRVETLTQLPWQPEIAWCLADLENTRDASPYAVDARNALQQVVDRYTALGLAPIVGPELEFYLCEASKDQPGALRRYVNHDSKVYTVGPYADPRGILERLLENAMDVGLGAFAANHEYGRGQFEINLDHSPAMDSADRAFRFKAMVKEVSAREGLLATFMGKPWNDDEGSGMHLHISLSTENGKNAFFDRDRLSQVSDLMLHFIAGILARGEALMAFLNPTVNAYRRINMKSLAPTHVNWGYDNRFTFIRIPVERGKATRVEIRVGDGTANPYIAYAALLQAGLDGIERKLMPPDPLAGLIFELPEEEQGPQLPKSMGQAIEALEKDDLLRAALGPELVDSFLVIKKYELERYHQWVSDWEIREYSHHL